MEGSHFHVQVLLGGAVGFLLSHESGQVQGCQEVYAEKVAIEGLVQVLCESVLGVQFQIGLNQFKSEDNVLCLRSLI